MGDPVREATHDDILEILQMCRKFAETIKLEIDREYFVPVLEQMINNENAVILVTEGGTLGGVLYPAYFDGKLMAQELWIWVDEKVRGNGIGGALLDEFELWAIARGASRTIMGTAQRLMPRKIGSIYKGKGYALQEHLYMKEF